MGVDLQTLRFLFAAKAAGTDFADALTLGRQHFCLDMKVYRREARRFGVPAYEDVFASYPFAEGLLRGLGANNPSSLDASSYEGATHIADLNRPIPNELAAKFSAVIDAGTLEHVFDIKQSCLNVANLLKVGGHFISVVPANNFLGHGFHQFGPELFYRVFSPENGFEVETMILTEVHKDAAWFEAKDPAKAHGRVELNGGSRAYLMARVRKTADVEMFQTIPQQSDYHDARWTADRSNEDTTWMREPLAQRIVETYVPRPVRQVLRRMKQALTSNFRSPHLTRVRSF
jgi:SAM-dependent methyltransferase